MTDDAQAIILLKQAAEKIPELRQMQQGSKVFAEWQRDTRVAIANVFGGDSEQVEEFKRIRWIPAGISYDRDAVELARQNAYLKGLHEVEPLLNSMLRQIEIYGLNADNSAQNSDGAQNVKKVFVVHGKEEGLKDRAELFLTKLGLEAIILHQQPDEGRTIIEKFEDYAEQVGFAVALCTADDLGTLNDRKENFRPRPRQNVIFELGFFNGKIGRNRVCALIEEGVEMPSDYDGVIYIQMNDPQGWQTLLFRRLREAGFDVDANPIV